MGILFISTIGVSNMWENLKKSKNGYCIVSRQPLQNVVYGGGSQKYCQSHYRLHFKNDFIWKVGMMSWWRPANVSSVIITLSTGFSAAGGFIRRHMVNHNDKHKSEYKIKMQKRKQLTLWIVGLHCDPATLHASETVSTRRYNVNYILVRDGFG